MIAPWSLGKRIAFRFVLLLWGLIAFPFFAYLVPGGDWLNDVLSWPITTLTLWFADHVLGLGSLDVTFTGSGDATVSYVHDLVCLILAVLGTAVWSVLDRRRPGYPRLAAAAHTLLRYYLASAMISYGISKVLKQQFPGPLASTLDQRLGDMSPMRLIWTFMGYSTPYTVFAGLGEFVGGLLLLWRRTAMLGALLIAVVMTNVVLINFCYDVPVKLYSSELLLCALAIMWPSARRVLSAVLGYATPEVPPRVRLSPRWERARKLAAVIMCGLLGYMVYVELKAAIQTAPPNDLDGTWLVERFELDGVERAPLITDRARWLRVSINQRTMWLTGMMEERTGFFLTLDAAKHTLALKPNENLYSGNEAAATWTYDHAASGELQITGVFRGHQVHAVMRRQKPGLLMTRGFHWINEVPFQR